MKKPIKYLVMDIDGTLTDGKIYIGGRGEIFKAFDVKDGYGISGMLPSAGIEPIIITGRQSDIVQYRCEELRIKQAFQGVGDKLEKLIDVLDGDLSQVAYFGDDLNDIPCMKSVRKAGGVAGCPADAIEEVKNEVDFVSVKNGGYGAAREYIEWIISKNENIDD